MGCTHRVGARAALGGAILAALLACTAAGAGGEPAQPGAWVLFKRDLPLRTVYAWERWGNFINSIPGDGRQIPYDAARLQVRVYTFPSGEIRVITFNKGVRTHDHVNMTDTIDYTWSGRRVVIANDQAAITAPGDASFHPKGVFHHGESLESGFGLEFAMQTNHVWPDPQVTWMPAASRPTEPAAAWIEGDAVREAYGADAASAPPDATRFNARSFDFPPYYTARELHLPRGITLPMGASHRDRLMILLSGSANFSRRADVWLIGVEDAVRSPAGELMRLSTLSDCVLIAADVPPQQPARQGSARGDAIKAPGCPAACAEGRQ